MAEKTFYDEITECLRGIRRAHGAVSVAPEVLADFMKDVPRPPRTGEVPAMDRSPVKESPAVPDISVEKTPVSVPAAAGGDVSAMDWETLAAAVSNCRKCRLCETRQHVVFEDGSRQARLLFFGEGPGADEDAQGVPFVGRAGELLNKMIAAMQFSRQEIYICNTVKCRPPGNRNPEPDETEACRAYALRQIALVKPEVIVVLGAVPLRFLFPKIFGGIKSMRGHWLDFNGIRVMPTYHPAYLLRDPAAKRDAWADLQQVMAVFGKKRPAK